MQERLLTPLHDGIFRMDASLLTPAVRQLIALSLEEDLHGGDITSDAIFDADQSGSATFRAKQELVLAGCSIAEAVLHEVDPRLTVTWLAQDGQRIGTGAFGTVTGPVRSILRGERAALNFVRKLSGVATTTATFAAALQGSGTKLLDTRKTTPGFRALEKHAVRMGGGHNHRLDLSSGAMLKNNHIDAAGGIAAAVAKVRARAPFLTMIEVEVRNEEEAAQAVAAGADAMLLDNMPLEQLRRIADTYRGRIKLEASGNVTLATLQALGTAGLDYVSSGWLTHSAPAADISLTIGGSYPPASLLETIATP
jgi:nicotinate-nucleotide pyrophosphorylase (carboxylating)